MPAKVDPPKSLRHLKYFVLRRNRNNDTYELIEPNKAQSYILGNAFQTRAYFTSIGMEYLGGRALDSATSFGASQALIEQNRAFGLDLCKVDLNAGIVKTDAQLDLESPAEWRETDEIVF